MASTTAHGLQSNERERPVSSISILEEAHRGKRLEDPELTPGGPHMLKGPLKVKTGLKA